MKALRGSTWKTHCSPAHPWSCTSWVDATGCNPSWLWEFKPKLQDSSWGCDHGKQDRRSVQTPASPSG